MTTERTAAQNAVVALIHGFPRHAEPRTRSVTCDGLLVGHISEDDEQEVVDLAATSGVADLTIGAPAKGLVMTGLADGIVHAVSNGRREEITVNGRPISCTVSQGGEFVTMADRYTEMAFDMEAIDAVIAALTRLKTLPRD